LAVPRAHLAIPFVSGPPKGCGLLTLVRSFIPLPAVGGFACAGAEVRPGDEDTHFGGVEERFGGQVAMTLATTPHPTESTAL